MHSILFSLHEQKEFHICPCSLLIIQWIFSQFPNDMLGLHSYSKSSCYFVKRIASRPWLVLNKLLQFVSRCWLAHSKPEFKQDVSVDCQIRAHPNFERALASSSDFTNAKISLYFFQDYEMFCEGEWVHSAFGHKFASGVACGQNLASGLAFGHKFASGMASD
jgi:hypothetical protein